ncbi:MAG: hypothetical protein LBI04_05845 [Treponema sp.]|jgi:pyruvate-formate lyase|nr:hypothetical protein [Treponema sp.]
MNEYTQKIIYAIEFTDIYKKYSGDKFIREAKCVDFQLEHILQPLEEGDLIAGMMHHELVGFSSQYGGIYTYFFHEHEFRNVFENCKNELTEGVLKKAEMILEFWKKENTRKKVSDRFIHKYGKEPGDSYRSAGYANCDCRVAGTNIDFEKLTRLGLDGLDDEINRYTNKNGNNSFYESLHQWIDTIRKSCMRYEREAVETANHCPQNKKDDFFKLANALKAIQHHAPRSFLEGLQLMWIYSVCSDTMNYGRMDDYLGRLYAQDLADGRLTEEEGVRLILGLYKHFKTIDKVHDCRVIIGGAGRQNPKDADKLAMVIMEASLRFKETVPQLTLRYYKEMDDEVLNKALKLNAAGCSFPIIYSDETNVPAVEQLYDINKEEAEQYVPFGCGEYVIVGKSVGTPNNGVNLLKALEILLHRGYDPFFCEQIETNVPPLNSYQTFEDLYNALFEMIKPTIEKLAWHKYLNYRVAGHEAPYLHLSLLMDNCIERGKALLDGGVKYLNAASEIFGIISCADSLTTIKKLVYDEKRLSLEKLVEILDADFDGYDAEHKWMIDAPKYGNDIDEADKIAIRVFDEIARLTSECGEKAGLHKYKIVSVNNSMSAEWGYFCGASACGRKRSAPLSNGNGPSISADKNGITALLNSMSKFGNDNHAGVINNVRFTRELFSASFEKIKFLVLTFFENNGVQLNICAVGKEDMKNAMIHPEQYQNLIVRIGGFSARFVTLEPSVQREIILRTTYEG